MTAVIPEAIELLDFAPVMPCEVRDCKSGRPSATHIIRWRPRCPHEETHLACRSCADRARQLIAELDELGAATDSLVFCGRCGSTWPGLLSEFLLVEPLP